jgi:hypothetical protein
MANQFSPDEDDRIPEKKSSQQLLLLLLLLLLAIFAYLYFFTGMIRPREIEPKPQPAPVAMVKKPLPPRLEQKGAPPATPVAKSATTGKEAETAAAPAKEANKPASPSAAKAAPAVKPATPVSEAKAVKPQAPAQQAKAEKPSAPPIKTAKPEAPAVKEAKPVAVSEKKPVAKAAAETKPVAKQAAGESGKTPHKAKVTAKTAAPAYVLELKDDLAPSEIRPVMAKLKQAGIGHVVQTKSQKGEPMHRLFLADFGNRDEALEELERLKLATSDAFMLKENGRYAVYAGSYLRKAKATVEQDRLLAKGVKLLVKDATAPVAVVKVRAGSFADQASAEKAAKSLKKGGLSAKVVKVGS